MQPAGADGMQPAESFAQIEMDGVVIDGFQKSPLRQKLRGGRPTSAFEDPDDDVLRDPPGDERPSSRAKSPGQTTVHNLERVHTPNGPGGANGIEDNSALPVPNGEIFAT